MLARPIRVIFHIIRRLGPKWNRLWFDLVESSTLREVSIGAGCRFQVPVRVGGGRGTLHIGASTSLGYSMAVKLGLGTILLQPRSADARIVIGSNTAFSNNVTICANHEIRIGDDCLIGDLVAVYDTDFHEVHPCRRHAGPGKILPVIIGNNVWLGSRVMVLKGVSIGDNSVVAAGSIVTTSLPENCLAAGSPARVVRKLVQV